MKRLVLSVFAFVIVCAGLFWKLSDPAKPPHETIQTNSAVDLKRLLKAKAIPHRQISPSHSETNGATTDADLDKNLVKLTPEQIAAYLQKYKRSPESLLTAFDHCKDPALLKEAAEKYPNHPLVQFTVLMRDDGDTKLSDEERKTWLDRFAKSSPNNGLPNVFAASDDLKNGNADQALAQLKAAMEKPGLKGFYLEGLQSNEEMFLSAGLSPAEAKEQALENLYIPLEAKMKGVAQQLEELEKSNLAAGNQAESTEMASVLNSLGRRWGDPSSGSPLLISELVGMAMQRMALNHLDPNTYYDFLGKTAGERIEEIKQQRAEIKALIGENAQYFAQLNEGDKMIYFDRLKMFGNRNAWGWLKQTHANDQATQGH